jgi:hypothetical protein
MPSHVGGRTEFIAGWSGDRLIRRETHNDMNVGKRDMHYKNITERAIPRGQKNYDLEQGHKSRVK